MLVVVAWERWPGRIGRGVPRERNASLADVRCLRSGVPPPTPTEAN